MFEPDVPVPFDHVIDGVYISGWRATKFPAELLKLGITNVLKLFDGTPYPPTGFNTFENAIEDGEPIPHDALERGVKFILERINAGECVLVMCGAGISRSSTFVLAYMLEKGHDLRDAFRLLRRSHPEAMPHPDLWESLCKYYRLEHTIDDLRNWLNYTDI
jgi:hypothetical protein